jgi:hypothetical protein
MACHAGLGAKLRKSDGVCICIGATGGARVIRKPVTQVQRMQDRNTPDWEWLKELTAEERSYWEAKPQAQRDWWMANRDIVQHPVQLLRNEIEIKRMNDRIRSMPKSTQDAIRKRISKEAEDARRRLGQRGLLGGDGDEGGGTRN